MPPSPLRRFRIFAFHCFRLPAASHLFRSFRTLQNFAFASLAAEATALFIIFAIHY